MLHDNINVQNGHLTFAGADTVALAKEYGTPLMLLDEERIRQRIRMYKREMTRLFGQDSGPLFAGKSLCFKGIYRLAREEDIRIDIVSPGELFTAYEAGFPMERAFFHGNNKTDRDVAFAMEHRIGYFVADSREELEAISAEASRRGITQKILLRITPGIDPHTHAAITTSGAGGAPLPHRLADLRGGALLPHGRDHGPLFGDDPKQVPLCPAPAQSGWRIRRALRGIGSHPRLPRPS